MNLLLLTIVVFLLFVLMSYGFLHCLVGSSIANHSTETNVASLTSNAQGINTETSAQQRKGSYPKLIGIDGQDDKAALLQGEYFKVFGNTWRNTDYVAMLLRGMSIAAAVGGNGFDRNPYAHVKAPVQFGPEEDYNFMMKNSGAVDHLWNVLLSYLPVIPPKGGNVITRMGSLTAADYGTTGAFGTAGTITDLNPAMKYRIWGFGGLGGADVGMLRAVSPDFDGCQLATLLFEDTLSMTYFPFDSLVHDGKSTLSIAASGGAATANIQYIILLEEYGPSNRQGTPGGPTGPKGARGAVRNIRGMLSNAMR